MDETVYVENNGFLSTWCCKCGNRHIWHFKVFKHKGKQMIEMSGFQDDKGTQLREFYDKRK